MTIIKIIFSYKHGKQQWHTIIIKYGTKNWTVVTKKFINKYVYGDLYRFACLHKVSRHECFADVDVVISAGEVGA